MRLTLIVLAVLLPFLGSPSPDRSGSAPGVFDTAVPRAWLPEEAPREAERVHGSCLVSPRGGEANGLPRRHDRIRPDSGSAPVRTVWAQSTGGPFAPVPARPPGESRHALRSPAASSSSALQVFRC
ncbi:hypothetical protein [Streptomyces nitrosporeus]|uniref:hypothetical protein n=1 Tax=Streptomyces nitrosporeus TaxID=28894 RepID=UPI00123CF736|nr:hypothetical protein [Streptomyces nitrosporeus]